jgi:hypothetical protein
MAEPGSRIQILGQAVSLFLSPLKRPSRPDKSAYDGRLSPWVNRKQYYDFLEILPFWQVKNIAFVYFFPENHQFGQKIGENR